MEVTRNERKTDRSPDHLSAAVDELREFADKKTIKLCSDIDEGTSSFRKLRKLRQFIDQTEFLKVVMEEGSDVLFAGGCQGFGKTIKADMMKIFFELLLDQNGKPLTFDKPCDSPNYECFEGTKIAANEDFLKKHFGKYPVIYLDFASHGDFSDVSSEEEMHMKFKRIISRAYKSHKYLCNSEELKSIWKTKCQKWCDGDFERLTKADIEDSLAFLVKYLCTHHRKQVFIIIDEVDAPCGTALFTEKKTPRELFHKIRSLSRNMLSPVAKRQPSLGHRNYHFEPYVKFYMTGMYFTLEGYSTMNNVMTIPLSRYERFGRYCGFNATDVDHLCNTFDVDKLEREKITEYHNALQYCGQGLNQLKIYNPRSVLIFIKSGTHTDFETLSFIRKMNHILVKHDEILWVLEHLLLGYNVEYSTDTQINSIVHDELRPLIDRLFNNESVSSENYVANTDGFQNKYRVQRTSTKVLLMFLTGNGCFSYVDGASPEYACIGLPNRAVREYLEDLFAKKFASNSQDVMLRVKIHAAIEIEVLIGLAKFDSNSKNFYATLEKLETHLQEIIKHEFNLPGKDFSESNVVHVLTNIFKKLTKIEAINTEYSAENELGERRRNGIQISFDKLIEIIIEVHINDDDTKTNSAQTALAEIFNKGYMHKIKTKYALALGCCVSHISSGPEGKKFICKFDGVGDETSLLKKSGSRKK